MAVSRHVPVLLEEVLTHWGAAVGSVGAAALPGAVSEPRRLLVDCTLGCGGHAAAMLQRLPNAVLIGMDVDCQALDEARTALEPFRSRAHIVHASYADIRDVLNSVPGGFADMV